MTDRQLFFKYNMQPTENRVKDETLDRDLYLGKIQWQVESCRGLLLLLHGSYACNLKCIYCENQHLRKEYQGALISEELIREIVDKLGESLREVTWHGGEPLLVPRNLMIALEEEKAKRGFTFETTLQTNSLLLDKEMIEFLDRYNIKFGTSFDGKYNSLSRGIKSTESILRCLKEFPERIGFIGVTYKDTIDSLIENYEYYKSLGVRNMQSCIVRENIIENDNPYLVENSVAISKMLEYIDYWIHDTSSPIRDDYVVRYISRLVGVAHTCEDVYCLGGWLIIDPLGNIGFCGHSPIDSGIVNIRDISSYEDILTNPTYLRDLYKQRRLVKSCEKCEWYHVCYGACMGLNYEYDQTYSSISPRNCQYNKGVLSGIYDLIKDIDITRRDLYNPLFLEILQQGNYYSLTEIKALEEEYSRG